MVRLRINKESFGMEIKELPVKSVMTKSNLPVSDYSVNPYVGCSHACKYCYAYFMKRFTNHPEPWGEFIDVKYWPEIKHPEKYAGKEAFLGSVTDCYQPCESKCVLALKMTRRSSRHLPSLIILKRKRPSWKKNWSSYDYTEQRHKSLF